MSTAAPQPPVIPARPVRSQDKDQMPKIPPRPINRRLERSRSPHRDRFAPSPLNFAGPKSPPRNISNGFNGAEDPINRSSSVDLPSVGEEGKEYAMVTEELNASVSTGTSPEQTRSVGDDLKLHAPKPSLPAMSAKQRVATVTRTDSDRAASFGIGRPSSDDPTASNRSLKKKASTISQISTADSHSHGDDEHGIPEIGLQVPMYPNAGDVQAPSPAPFAAASGADSAKPRHHARKTSARGFTDVLPPGSYGLHGHGMKPEHKLERAYYEKHPELIRQENSSQYQDRPGFSMSREELNKIVRDTASRGTGKDFGTPSEQVGWEALEESASRIASPRPTSVGSKSPTKRGGFNPEIEISQADAIGDDTVIHVEEPNRRRSVMFSDDDLSGSDKADERRYSAPILAEDEVAKNPQSFDMQPAVSPPPERSGSAFEMEPSSRPTSRPSSIYRDSSTDIRSTPLEDVEEYEPLFPDDDKTAKHEAHSPNKSETKKQRFPGRDIWEDAPDSVHHTAEVETPDVTHEENEESHSPPRMVPPRDIETPAHAWARRHEELAEAESKQNPDAFLNRKQKPTWIHGHSHLSQEMEASSDKGGSTKRPSAQRFPSQDVWEDSPDSHMLETTVDQEQEENEESSPVESHKPPEIPQRPAKSSGESPSTTEKPAIPARPKPKQAGSGPGDDGVAEKPVVPERPKPQVPSRPAKYPAVAVKDSSDASSGSAAASSPAPVPKAKPAVPARPVGGKIAALQAGFMSDLNKRLQLGPQAPKKEEPAAQEQAEEEKEKAPLVDARKGRARGPQRRAPAKSQSPSPAAALVTTAPAFSFSTTLTVFSIDPEEPELQTEATKGEVESKSVLEQAAEAAEIPETKAEDEKPQVNLEPVEKEEEEVTKPDDETTTTKTETLASNMAGEAVVEAELEKSQEKDDVEPVKVEEVVKD